MGGRYRLSRRKQLVEEHFATGPCEDDWEPRYNIAPTQPVPVIRQDRKEPVRHHGEESIRERPRRTVNSERTGTLARLGARFGMTLLSTP
jgi:putative SOS response-associated peptidase YedK